MIFLYIHQIFHFFSNPFLKKITAKLWIYLLSPHLTPNNTKGLFIEVLFSEYIASCYQEKNYKAYEKDI